MSDVSNTPFQHPWWYYRHYERVFGTTRQYDADIALINDRTRLQDADVREIGAGTGGHAEAVLRYSPRSLLLVDKDPQAFRVLQERFAGDARVTVSLADGLSAVAVHPATDVTLCMFAVLQQVTTPEAFRRNVVNALRGQRVSGCFAGEFVDTTRSRDIYPAGLATLLFQEQPDVMEVTSHYGSSSSKVSYRGRLEGRDASYDVCLLNLDEDRVREETKLVAEIVDLAYLSRDRRRCLFLATHIAGLKRPVVLIGPAGVGKTTVAAAMEKIAPVKSVDVDERFVARFGPIGRYGEQFGWREYFEKQSQVLVETIEEAVTGRVPHVIAAPAGALWREEYPDIVARNLGILANRVTFICLVANSDHKLGATLSIAREYERGYEIDEKAKTARYLTQVEKYSRISVATVVNEGLPWQTATRVLEELRKMKS